MKVFNKIFFSRPFGRLILPTSISKTSHWLIIVFLLTFHIAQAQTLHAIIVGGTTKDTDIGEENAVSVESMRDELEKIDEYTNLRLRTYDFTGDFFDSQRLRRSIDNIECGYDDAIFFYYVGHGLRYSNQQNPWPILAVGYDINSVSDLYEQGIPLQWIFDKLKQKNPRLLIVISESCNDTKTYKAPTIKEFKGQASLSFGIRDSRRFKELYEDSKGSLIVSSSEPGQVSKTTKSFGGYFTSAFTEVHKELTSISNNANWNDLLEKAKDRTIRLAKLNGFHQYPQYKIDIKSIETKSPEWRGTITSDRDVFRNKPAHFQQESPYNQQKYPIARIVMFSSNRIFFLMSDNYIVEWAPYGGGLILTGYRAFSNQPYRFQWDIVNPVTPYYANVFGVDINGNIWSWNNYILQWVNVGVVYY
jgi:hypothetical protein